MRYKYVFFMALLAGAASAGAQDNRTAVEPQLQATSSKEKVLKRKVAIARFSNETQYGKGIFYDKENDPMAKQALDILSTRLASTGKFLLLERSDLDKALGEAQGSGEDYKKIGADYIIIGSITQFGRKNTGDVGLFSSAKTQLVEAAVSLRLIDVSTGQIIYSEEATGSAEMKSKTTMGLGGTADFDATLSDKAISAAISQLTENIINNCMDRPWKAYFLTVDEGTIYISGGKSQGVNVDDVFTVKEKGKSVKNPQTGMMMELPGKTAGKIKITLTGGESSDAEFAVVEFIEGKIDENKLDNYYIVENK
jgi:curli biogenesis system outer membrane secretion channel CsgG